MMVINGMGMQPTPSITEVSMSEKKQVDQIL